MSIIPLSIKRRVKLTINDFLLRRGYQISKTKSFDENLTFSAFDIQKAALAEETAAPIIFDVGANRGQTTAHYRALFPTANIHLFEPITEFYAECCRATSNDPGIFRNNVALSSLDGKILFHETAAGQSSSVLTQSDRIPFFFSQRDFTPSRSYEVVTRSIDSYCREKSISKIDILKLDTEGHELSVLNGAQAMLADGRIKQVYTEINFEKFWDQCALYHHIASYLEGFGLDLFAIYGLGTGAKGATKSGDALFMHGDRKKRILSAAFTGNELTR